MSWQISYDLLQKEYVMERLKSSLMTFYIQYEHTIKRQEFALPRELKTIYSYSYTPYIDQTLHQLVILLPNYILLITISRWWCTVSFEGIKMFRVKIDWNCNYLDYYTIPFDLSFGTPSAIRPELAFSRAEHSLPYSDVTIYIFAILYLSSMLYVYRFLWPLRLGWLLVCCLYKEVYLQIFKCMSFWLHGCCG